MQNTSMSISGALAAIALFSDDWLSGWGALQLMRSKATDDWLSGCGALQLLRSKATLANSSRNSYTLTIETAQKMSQARQSELRPHSTSVRLF